MSSQEFVKELTIWSKLKHPNVLPLLGYYYEGNFPYIISEWMEYGTARNYVDKSELSAKKLLDMVSISVEFCRSNILTWVVTGDCKWGRLYSSRKLRPL